MLIARALEGRDRDEVLISVKFGAQRGPDGGWLGYDARPPAVKTALAYSLQRLRTDHIDIYRPARLDPQGADRGDDRRDRGDGARPGYVRCIGLSEVGAETIRRAAAVHPICDLQIEYSLISRGIEAEILPACRELGIGDHRLRRALARADQRALLRRAPARPGGLPQPSPAVSGREPGAQPGPGGGSCGRSPREGRDRGADRDRLGAVARRGHRAADRRPHARAAAPRRSARWI